VSWDDPTNIVVLGIEMIKDMEEQIVKIKENLEVAHEKQKIYADKGRVYREFRVGEHVFVKVNTKKSSLKLGNCTKLAARFCGPFEILDRISLVAYMLELPSSMNVHNLFHVSLLKMYVHDPYYVNG